MSHNGPTIDDPSSAGTDPYASLLTGILGPRWTDAQLNKHIMEAVKYGVAMERDRILSATRHLNYEDTGVISGGGPHSPGGAV